jgi:preprotein translocase subunit SecF
MEFFKRQTHFHFMGLKKYTTGLALVLCLFSIGLLTFKGLHFGLEFTGGTQIELRFNQAVEPEHVQDVMQQLGFSGMRVQLYGSTQDVLVRAANMQQAGSQASANDVQLQQKIIAAFEQAGDQVQVRRVEYVGSEVGHQLAEQGAIAVIVSILATMAYIAMRFEYRFAVSAALALAHDALIVLGAFVLFQVEFDLAALAAILAVVGYSLNDKIVVFDRVRENFRTQRNGTPVEVMDGALNQTLSRTIMTSFMTMLVVLALLIFGGSSLFSFSLALCIGIAVGTYSSIFVASALAIILGLSRHDLMPKPKVVVDNRP